MWLRAGVVFRHSASLPLLVKLSICLYHFEAVMLVVEDRLHGCSGVYTPGMAATDTLQQLHLIVIYAARRCNRSGTPLSFPAAQLMMGLNAVTLLEAAGVLGGALRGSILVS